MITAKEKRKPSSRIGVAVLLLGLTAGGVGCARDNGPGAKSHRPWSQPPEEVAMVGLDTCTSCHEGQVMQWLTGQHANLEAIDHVTYAPLNLGLDSDGFPYYGYFEDETCALCHDQLEDGQRLTSMWTGNVPRPLIGCESCHGGGAQHFGAGAIPFPKPDHQRCGQCHNADFPDGHLPYHPNGDNIVEDYEDSAHSTSINQYALATALSHGGDKTGGETVQAACARCHTDEGYRELVEDVSGYLGYYDLLRAVEDTGLSTITDASPVECRTCHDSHEATADNLTRLEASTVNGNAQSAEYNLCTSCHQLSDENGLVQTAAFHDPKAPYGRLESVITDTHAAVPGNTRLNSGPTEQFLYFVKKADANACAACHNPHLGGTEINRQYAQSGHGNALGDPWIHYDWKHSGRASCQRCHTTTGFLNFADSRINSTVYNPALNDFSWLLTNENPRVDGNDQMQTIYCWGCHTDYKGTLRNPGPFNITAIEPTYVRMDNTGIIYPDVSGSNVCMLCHTGRTSGGTIRNSADNFSNVSFKNSHYLTGGGVLFGEIGYEYPALDYTNVSYFEHGVIGLPGAPAETGTNGPCVGCHMKTHEPHLFEPIAETGNTIEIHSNACVACHNGEHELTGEELKEEKEHYHAALEAFRHQLSLRTRADGGTGYWWNGCNPYFFKTLADATNCTSANSVKNWCTPGDPNCAIAATTTGKPNMGAAYNFNMLEHDPGGFVHNRYYTKRLIYDSMDWIDDNLLNDSVAANLNALDPAVYPFRDMAIAYLIVDGGRP